MSRECEENNSNVKTLNERRMLFDKLIELDFDKIDRMPNFYAHSMLAIGRFDKDLAISIELDFKEDLQNDKK